MDNTAYVNSGEYLTYSERLKIQEDELFKTLTNIRPLLDEFKEIQFALIRGTGERLVNTLSGLLSDSNDVDILVPNDEPSIKKVKKGLELLAEAGLITVERVFMTDEEALAQGRDDAVSPEGLYSLGGMARIRVNSDPPVFVDIFSDVGKKSDSGEFVLLAGITPEGTPIGGDEDEKGVFRQNEMVEVDVMSDPPLRIPIITGLGVRASYLQTQLKVAMNLPDSDTIPYRAIRAALSVFDQGIDRLTTIRKLPKHRQCSPQGLFCVVQPREENEDTGERLHTEDLEAEPV